MSQPKNLFDDLRERKAKATASAVDWPARKREWLLDLDALIANARKWLQPGVKEGLVKIRKEKVRISEGLLGPYDAPGLRIETAGGDVVTLEPVGTVIIGAAGRVDLSCGPRRAMILRTKTRKWKFAGGTAKDLIDVTGKTFTEAVQELIQ